MTTLSKIDLQLLIILALYETSGSEAKKIKRVMEILLGAVFNDMPQHIQVLRNKMLAETCGYNWRTDTYDYRVPEDKLISVMLFIYKEHGEEVLEVMDAVKKTLSPSYMQRLLWEFITSDFTKLDIEKFSNSEVGSNLELLVPVAGDWRFAPLIMMLDPTDFFEVLQLSLAGAIANGKIISADAYRQIINNYKVKGLGDMKERLLCLTDLYDYLANGSMPEKLLASNKNHRIIAGIHEAYHGQYAKALEHFKKAVSLNNRSSGYYTSSKSYLVLSIANFFYVLIAFLVSTEEGKKKATAVTKATDKQSTASARALFNILYSTSTDKQIKQALSDLGSSVYDIDRQLAQLMSLYIGKQSGHIIQPQWLIMKQEMRKYLPLDEETAALCDKAYGTQGLLSSIYHKQEWEYVLEDLMGLGGGNGAAASQKDVRIAYLLRDIRSNTVQLRQQTMLKNGSWGAGKQVNINNFLNNNVEGMTQDDIEIARAARRDAGYSYDFPLSHVLPFMAQESRLYVGHYAPFTLVEVTEEMPYITLHHDSEGFLITSNVPETQVDSKIIITHRGAASINFIQLSEQQRPYYRRLLSLGHFPNEAEDQLRAFLAGIGGKIEVNSDLVEGGSTLPLTEGSPVLVMQMRPQDRETYAVGLFVRPLEGGTIKCVPGQGNEVIIDGKGSQRTRVQRNISKEQENLNHFIDALYEEVNDVSSFVSDTTCVVPYFDLLPIIEYAQQNPDRISCEWPEGAQMKVKQRSSAGGWNGAIKKNENGWFEIEGSVELDQDKVVTMAQLLDLVNQSHGRYIKLGEGEFLALSDKLRKQLDQLNTIASRTRGKLQMSPFSAALIGADTFDGELFLAEDDELKKIRQRIKESSTYSPRVPKELNATLREYQKEGFQWMARLNSWGAGALLADDMGLGKTIQTITFLLSKAKEGPALVIAPASVAPNWITEFEKFAPSLRVTMLNYVGDRTDAIQHARPGDVIVTTYGLLLSVERDVTKKHWTTICLDEAHIIKNRGAKTSAVAMKLHSDYRIMLTGTPVQNHLGELWNLFQFVNPGLLGSFEDFNRRFIVPIEQNRDEERQHDLDRLVKPFMLRRTKDKVAKELPEKTEIYQQVNLTEEEMLIYETLRQKAEALLLSEGTDKVSVNTLAEITRLRQCACDTRLATPSNAKDRKTDALSVPGSKITALVELLQTIIEGGARTLVFSQFTSYLALVKEALDAVKIPYLYIDGSIDIKTRTKLVEDFQNGTTPVFLISLKAGGLGLNLTRANYVIHMDPWWNPAIEAQATDRAHRIGQQQRVTVYHLIASGTIEEKIQRLHERKKALVENILDSTDMSHKLTGEELLEMVSR